MEYLDLSSYEYGKFPIPMRSIGWLGGRYGLQSDGEPLEVNGDLERLRAASRRLGSLTLGTHECEFCPEGSAFEGNGEYRYYIRDGDVYSAPMMILHYFTSHGYRPPRVFMESLKETDELTWDWRAERLSGLLLDESADWDFRCEAIIDLANWQDSRALDALLHAAREEELVDVAGVEIGQSLGLFLGYDFAKGLHIEDFSGDVRFGIDQILRQRSTGL